MEKNEYQRESEKGRDTLFFKSCLFLCQVEVKRMGMEIPSTALLAYQCTPNVARRTQNKANDMEAQWEASGIL